MFFCAILAQSVLLEVTMVEKKRTKKPHELVPLMLRLREALRQRLAKDAEKAAKSLNAEIVDRLEASYTKDERIEELRGRAAALDQRIADSRVEYEKDRDRLMAQVADARLEVEKALAASKAECAKLEAELKMEVSRLEGADAVLEGFLGENKQKAQLLRLLAIEIAKIPDDKFAVVGDASQVREQVNAQFKKYLARTA
jgi:hypothetical protein